MYEKYVREDPQREKKHRQGMRESLVYAEDVLCKNQNVKIESPKNQCEASHNKHGVQWHDGNR